MFGELLQLAWNNIKAAGLRLLMTAAGIVVGTCAVILLVALTIGLQAIAESSLGSNAILTEITIYPSQLASSSDERPLLNDAALANFETFSEVEATVPLLALGGRSKLEVNGAVNYAEVYGIPAEKLSSMNFQAESGSLSLADGQAIFGASVPLYFVDPEAETFEPVDIDIYQSNIELTLSRFDSQERILPLSTAAILQADTSRFDNAVFIAMSSLLAHKAWLNPDFNPENFEYDQVLVRTADREVTNPLRERFNEMGYETDSVGEFLDDLNSFFIMMRLVLGATGGIALLVAAFVVANTMMMSVLERTSEIGLMKAIGARDSDILLIFLMESGLIGLSGGIVGVLCAYWIANIINDAILSNPMESTSQIGFLPINTAMLNGSELIIITNELAIIGIGIATLVGVASGIFPAWRAARMSPVDALKA